MAGDDEEIVIKIDDELADGLGIEGSGTVKNEDALESLKSQYSTLKTAADRNQSERDTALRQVAEANRAAEDARREAADAQVQVVESQYDTVVSGLSAAETEATAAAKEYQAAFEAGDGAAASVAQRKIAKAEAKISRLEEAKESLEDTKPKAGERGQQRQEPARTQAADPVQAYVNGRTEPTKAWLLDHRDYITDPKKNAKLTAAHYDAVAEGIALDSPEYFAHVEERIGLKAADKTAARQQTTRRPAAPTTPVANAGGGMNGGAAEVRLTSTEARAATDGTLVWNYDDPSGNKRFKKGDPIGHQEFAKRKLAMQKEGRYDRSMTE